MLTSDFLTQRRLLDKFACPALVMSYDLFTRPSETSKISSLDVIASQAWGYQSVSVIIAQSVAASDVTAARLPKSGQFDDTVMVGLLGLHLEFVRVLLTRLKVACPFDLQLLAPLTFIERDQALKNAATRTRLTVEDLTTLRSPRRRQYSSVQAVSESARRSKKRTVAWRKLCATL